MDLTIILARFWGTILLIACASLLLNKNLLQVISKAKDKRDYMLLSGFIALLIGALHVSVYNYWEVSPRGIITLFGWAALVKGVVRFIDPNFSRKSVAYVVKDKTLYTSLIVFFSAVGIYLCYVGFVK